MGLLDKFLFGIKFKIEEQTFFDCGTVDVGLLEGATKESSDGNDLVIVDGYGMEKTTSKTDGDESNGTTVVLRCMVEANTTTGCIENDGVTLVEDHRRDETRDLLNTISRNHKQGTISEYLISKSSVGGTGSMVTSGGGMSGGRKVERGAKKTTKRIQSRSKTGGRKPKKAMAKKEKKFGAKSLTGKEPLYDSSQPGVLCYFSRASPEEGEIPKGVVDTHRYEP